MLLKKCILYFASDYSDTMVCLLCNSYTTVHLLCNSYTSVCLLCNIYTTVYLLCNNYTTVYPPVRGDNPRAVASGLSPV